MGALQMIGGNCDHTLIILKGHLQFLHQRGKRAERLRGSRPRASQWTVGL